jgi:hypothetical protein
MTGQLHNERVLVVEEGVIADRTDLRGFQFGAGDSVESYSVISGDSKVSANVV